MNIGDTLKDIFTRGVGGWADSQIAQQYQANNPVPGSAASAYGSGAAGAGQYAVGGVPAWVLFAAAGVALVAILAIRK